MTKVCLLKSFNHCVYLNLSHQVTRAQLEAQKQIDLEIQKQQMRKREQEKKHTVTPEEYEEVVSRPNLNREEDLLIARGVDQAISGLSEMGIADPAASPVSVLALSDSQERLTFCAPCRTHTRKRG